jgi:hypothetical protein
VHSGHECEWKDKHYDIPSTKAINSMFISGMDYDNQVHYIGGVELKVSTFLVTGEKKIQIYNNSGKPAGHIWFDSEFIPIPKEEPMASKEEWSRLTGVVPTIPKSEGEVFEYPS